MKKLSFIALSLALALPAAAQQYGYAPGQLSFGGRAIFQDGPDFFGSENIEFAAEPMIGYSLQNGLMVGTSVLFSVTGDGDFTTWGLRPFLRKNAPIADRAGAYALVAPMFALTSAPSESSIRTFGAEIDAGVYYFISQKFSVELSLAGLEWQYNSYRDPDGEEYDSESNFALGYLMQGAEVSVLYHF